ncbi:protein kinase [candidate division KSB1 bacterium]|nr:protein kinase [candidate division KSB1 bacterium]
MGVVYKAEDTKLKRFVALKFLPPDLTRDEEAKERFVQEAQAASALDHPNICTIYEIDETEDGQMFIAMAYYEGETLKKRIAKGEERREKGEERAAPIAPRSSPFGMACGLPMADAIEIAIQIAQGLAKAHQHGIVHRDIKPANIIITKDDVVKIIDFGIAKLAGRKMRLAKTGKTVGTLAYVSPEQARGEEVDHRTDVWSLGVVLYEMLTSRLPFIHEYEAAIIYSIINEDPIPPAELRDDVPKALEDVTLKCLQKELHDRYPSAKHLLSELKKLKKILESGQPEAVVARREKPETRKETERRQATIMFAQISGYTEMLEKLDPEEVAANMSQCFEMFGAMAHKYGGTIDKIMGSCVTVRFGAPQAIENAPQKAINAAIEMRNQLQQFNLKKNLAIPLNTQIGINTGMVVAGAVGSDQTKEYAVIGGTVELASNLMALCANGQIYVGPLTYRYTRNEFDFKELKPITLKGIKAAVPVFELLSVREKIHRPRLGAGRMIYSKMVGREKELDKLKLHVLKAINGEGSIVSVIGEAGIGKSRLMAELRTMEDVKSATLLEGRALSIGQNLSYHPLIDILKNWANITEEDGEAEATSKLEKTIVKIHPEGVDEVLPFVATLMGMKLTAKHAERVKGIEGEAMKKLILKNMRELMMKGAELHPLVIIIEDLHWADLSSIELLESLYRLAENHRILFVNVFRPNYRETGERILQTIRKRYSRCHAEIYLEPLDDNQCAVLIRNLLKASGLPTGIRSAIANRAEGNPFFIEEVVWSFVDEGVIEPGNGKFKITEKIESVVIPATIQEVLLARIDKLDEKTKSLLKVASVIGRSFFYKILVEVAKNIEEIDERLEHLKDIQLIRERRRLEELEYFFKHALVQEVTYESILLKKRKDLHLQIANAIESVFSDRLHEFYGMLAFHYSKAANLEKAEEYLIKAGEEALKAAASSEALSYYQEALKLYLNQFGETADPGKIAMLEKNIALAFYNKGHLVEAVEHFDKALECFGESISRHKIVIVGKFLVNLLLVLKGLYWPSKKEKRIPGIRDIEVIGLYYKRGEALSTINPIRLFIDSIGVFGLLSKFDLKVIEGAAGIYAAGSVLFAGASISFSISQKFLDVSRQYINENDVKSVLKHKVFELGHNFLVGKWDRGYKIDEKLVNANLHLGELYMALGYLNSSFNVALWCGDFAYAAMLIKRISDISNTYEYDLGRLTALISRSLYQLNKGLFHDLVKYLDESSIFARKLGFGFWSILILALKTKMQIMTKDITGAEKSLTEAKRMLSESSNIPPLCRWAIFLSQFLLDVHQFKKVLLSGPSGKDAMKLREIKKAAHKCGKAAIKWSRWGVAGKLEALRLMGTLHWLETKQKKALKFWDECIKSAEPLGARPELARTYMEIGKHLLEKKSKHRGLNGISAEVYLEKARALFAEMELEWDLEELERAEQRA